MYLTDYCSSIKNQDLVDSILKTSAQFLMKMNEQYVNSSTLNALLFGHVQSGKTAQMLGIMSAMADEGFKIFLVLTSDNVDLYRQTYLRVKRSLSEFHVLNEREDHFLGSVILAKPLVVVLKKNSRVLGKWKNCFLNTEICKGLPLVVIDDEADAASLNTLVNKHRISTIYKHLSDIKNTSPSCIYIEVTATPQALLLQSNFSGWRPDFVCYFTPGKNYLGGNYFYPQNKSFTTVFTDDFELDEVANGGDVICPRGLSRSLLSFLINCAHKKLNHSTNCNFLIHPSSRIFIQEQFLEVVQNHLTLLQKSLDEEAFRLNLKEEWNDLQQSSPDLDNFEDVQESVSEILNNTDIRIIPLNSNSFVSRNPEDPDSLDLSQGFNILIGGNSLGRGITLPNLQTVYYCRTSKTPQADTYWQHSRVFGYDREKQLVRVFIPKLLYSLFSELNSANEILIKQIEKGFDNIQLVYPMQIIPTRKNVIDKSRLCIVTGGINIFASMPSNISVEQIDNLIDHYSDEKYVDCEDELLIRVLELVQSEQKEDFDTQKFIGCIKAIKQRKPNIKCKLIVRKSRSISKFTGTLLSPSDRNLGDSFYNDIVLTMYRIIGEHEKGWNGKPLWIPNIRFPNNFLFYNVND